MGVRIGVTSPRSASCHCVAAGNTRPDLERVPKPPIRPSPQAKTRSPARHVLSATADPFRPTAAAPTDPNALPKASLCRSLLVAAQSGGRPHLIRTGTCLPHPPAGLPLPPLLLTSWVPASRALPLAPLRSAPAPTRRRVASVHGHTAWSPRNTVRGHPHDSRNQPGCTCASYCSNTAQPPSAAAALPHKGGCPGACVAGMRRAVALRARYREEPEEGIG